MQEDKHKDQATETASATSSSSNNSSGPFAYILFGVVAILLVVFSLVSGGCVSAYITAAASSFDTVGYDSSNGYSGIPYDQDFNYDELDDLINQYTQDWGGTQSRKEDRAGTCTVEEALDYDLAPYSVTLSREVSASAYAGTPGEVREFVRSVITKDDECSSALTRLLNSAATSKDVRSGKITEAISYCEECAKAIADIALPTLAKGTDKSLTDDLGSAKTKAVDRWNALAEELKLLSTDGDINKRDLWDADEKVVNTTTDAGNLFEDAMTKAAVK